MYVKEPMHASGLAGRKFDGIEMDIGGAEAGLLDDDLIPECRKLVLEYHTSRDQSMDNLRRRLAYLKSRFRTVRYPPELDRLVAAGGHTTTYFDRVIHCIR